MRHAVHAVCSENVTVHMGTYFTMHYHNTQILSSPFKCMCCLYYLPPKTKVLFSLEDLAQEKCTYYCCFPWKNILSYVCKMCIQPENTRLCKTNVFLKTWKLFQVHMLLPKINCSSWILLFYIPAIYCCQPSPESGPGWSLNIFKSILFGFHSVMLASLNIIL